MRKIEKGLTASLSKAFSSEEVELFSRISMDSNRLHVDDQYAKMSLFHRRIVHGFLSGSLISAVIGTILPGEGTIYLHQDMDFKNPVFIDELLTAIITVEEVKEDKHICYLRTQCVNSQGELKIDGKAVVKYL